MSETSVELDDPSRDPRGPVVRRAVLHFTAWSLVALTVVAAGTTLVSVWVAREQALREARERAVAIANTLASPLVDRAVRDRVPGAANRLAQTLHNRMRDGSVSHIKLWSRDGTVIWSDEPALVGRRFELETDVRGLFGTRGAVAEVSGLEKEENVLDRGGDTQLLEVYVGTVDADGAPMVLEAYLSTQRMRDAQRALLSAFLPVGVGGLLLFLVAVLPAAVRLARRVERAQLERSRVMRHALMSSDLERRRISQDLHDGVIPDLAGVGYILTSVERQVSKAQLPEPTREALHRVSEVVTSDVAALRSLLGDIYPPRLGDEELESAVRDLVGSTCPEDLSASVEIPDRLGLPDGAAKLAYRVIREGLRNVVKHARASRVTVRVRHNGEFVVVQVLDDGVGTRSGGKADSGHLGLRLLEDTVVDIGGRLTLSSPAAGGTLLEARFPVALTGAPL